MPDFVQNFAAVELRVHFSAGFDHTKPPVQQHMLPHVCVLEVKVLQATQLSLPGILLPSTSACRTFAGTLACGMHF